MGEGLDWSRTRASERSGSGGIGCDEWRISAMNFGHAWGENARWDSGVAKKNSKCEADHTTRAVKRRHAMGKAAKQQRAAAAAAAAASSSSKSSSSSWTLYGLVAVAVAIAVQAFLLYGSPSTTTTEPEPPPPLPAAVCPPSWAECPRIPGADWVALAALEQEASSAPSREALEAYCSPRELLSQQEVRGMHLFCVLPPDETADGGNATRLVVFSDMNDGPSGPPPSVVALPAGLRTAADAIAARAPHAEAAAAPARRRAAPARRALLRPRRPDRDRRRPPLPAPRPAPRGRPVAVAAGAHRPRPRVARFGRQGRGDARGDQVDEAARRRDRGAPRDPLPPRVPPSAAHAAARCHQPPPRRRPPPSVTRRTF